MRVLIVKTSSLGDVVHNLPAVSDLAAAIPGVRIDWCVEEAFAEIPALHPAVSRVIPVAIRRWRKKLFAPATVAEIRAFRNSLRSTRYDAVVDTQGLLKSALLTRMANGVGHGYARDSARESLASRFYRHRVSVSRACHAVTRNRRLTAAALGYGIDPDRIDYGIAPAPLACDWLPADYVVCLTATSRSDKLWPEDHWIELLEFLAAEGIAAVLPAGSASERARAAGLCAASTAARPAPPLGIAELAGLLRGARATIGVDTGLSHLSVAVGTPTLALYMATDPGLTGVAGPGHCRNLGGKGRMPSPAEVRQALDAALALPAGER